MKSGSEAALEVFDGLRDVINSQSNYFKMELPDLIEEKNRIINTLLELLYECIGGGYRLVIVVDELDRCRPKYALKVLEIIKHILGVRGVKYIFALDVDILSKTLSKVYKNELVSGNYLIRFFDVIIDLKNTYSRSSKYIESILKKKEIEPRLRYFLYELMKHFNLSLREINIVLNDYKVLDCLISLKDEFDGAKILILFFLTVKYKFLEKYKAIFDNAWDKEGYKKAIKQVYSNCSSLIKEYLIIDLNFLDAPLLAGEIETFPLKEREIVYYIKNFFKNYKNDKEILLGRIDGEIKNKDEFDSFHRYSNLTIRDYISYKLNLYINPIDKKIMTRHCLCNKIKI